MKQVWILFYVGTMKADKLWLKETMGFGNRGSNYGFRNMTHTSDVDI